MKRRSSRTLELTLRTAQQRGFRDCPALFHAMAGVLRAASVFADLPPAPVAARLQPFSAHYELTLPTLRHQAFDEAELELRRSLFGDWQRRLHTLR